MRLQRLTNYLLSHRFRAMAATFLITLIPIVSVFGILFAALVTLVRGAKEGAIFTIVATLPYLFSFSLAGNHDAVPMMAWAAVGVAVASNVLTYIFAVMLTQRVSWSMMMQLAALCGVLVISVVHLVYPDVQDWWSTQLNAYFTQAGEILKGNSPMSGESRIEIVNMAKQLATGFIVAAVLFNAFLQLIAAAWWKAIVYSPGSLSQELHQVRLSHLAGVLFLTSLVFSYLGNAVVLDIMPVLYLLFTAAGLSLVHYFLGYVKTPVIWFWLSLLYVMVFFAMPVSFVAMSIFALTDIWLDVRKKIKKG